MRGKGRARSSRTAGGVRSRWRRLARAAAGLAGAGAVVGVLGLGAAVAVRRGRQQREEPGSSPDLSGAPFRLESRPRGTAAQPANARVAPPPWEPAPLTALASWEPPPPQSAVGRTAAYLWASPVTLLGLLIGAAAGVRPVVRAGVLVFPHARGITGAVLRGAGYAAGAFGHVVVSTVDPSDVLLAHELVHVRHAERLGAFLAPVYLGLLAVYGYARHPLERAARAAGRRAAGAPA